MIIMLSLQDYHRTFIALIRLGIGHYSDRLPDTIDWIHIQKIAAEQGLYAIVLDGIEQLSEKQRPPQKVLLEWIGEVFQGYEYRYDQYCKAISELAGFYNSHGYKMMVLKGYACCLDWPNPKHRPCGDIDIWQFGKQKEADDSLQQAQEPGFKIECDQHHHTIFNWGEFTVENHYDFVNVHAHQSNKELEKIFKVLGSEVNLKENNNHKSVGNQIPSVDVCDEKVYLPSPDLHALFLLRHMASHFAAEGITLRNVLDWGFFMDNHSKEIDWKWLMPIIEEFHMHDFLNCINAICVEDLGFDTSIFPLIHFLPQLKDKVLDDIVNPKFQHNPPTQIYVRLWFKYRRWKANEWKRKLCYNENGLSDFISGVWAHLLKPSSI